MGGYSGYRVINGYILSFLAIYGRVTGLRVYGRLGVGAGYRRLTGGLRAAYVASTDVCHSLAPQGGAIAI